MFNCFGFARKGLSTLLQRVALLVGVLALAACDLPSGGGANAGKGKGDGKTLQVALLVPYGSPSLGDDLLAQSLERAARLALADLGRKDIQLKVYPTKGNAQVAAAAADQAVANGADIILGPLRSDAANAAALAVRDDGVNVLAFSNNATIAGGNLFILGNTFENIASRLVSYSAAKGRGRIVVAHPDTAVGQIAKNAIAMAAQKSSASVVATESFPFSQDGIIRAAPSIARAIRKSGANALLLTSESTGALPLLGQLLPEQGVDPAVIKYLGMTRWDIPRDTLKLPGLQGGWFTLPDPNLVGRFNDRYSSQFGTGPHPLAGLAYDGMAAIGALRSNKLPLSGKNLTRSSGFIGVNGVFRFQPNGTNQRALAIAQASRDQVRIIDPAPKSFGGSGF